MYDVVDQEVSEKAVDNYDQFVGPEVCIPDEWWRKIMAWVTNCVEDNRGKPKRIEYPALFAYNSLYEY